jgi:drug/metabolite transporter (DMT)-like permease
MKQEYNDDTIIDATDKNVFEAIELNNNNQDNNVLESTTTTASQTETENNSTPNASSTTSSSQMMNKLFIIGMIANVIAHLLFGSDPPLSRYLQKKAQLSALTLLAMSHVVAFLLYSPRTIYLIVKTIRKRRLRNNNNEEEEEDTIRQYTTSSRYSRIRDFVFRYWLLYAFGFFVTIRLLGAMYAAKFTSATFVQLIMLLMPFIVVFVGYFILNEKITLVTIGGMLFIVVGGTLVVLGSFNQSRDSTSYKFYWTINFSALAQNFTLNDVLGISLSFFSTVSLAFMNIVVRGGASIVNMSEEDVSRSRFKSYLKQNTRPASSEDFFYVQLVVVPLVLIIPSILVEDWSSWLHFNTLDWVAFIAHSIFITLSASQLSFVGMQYLGATNASSTLALRLVSAVILAGFILGEWINNIFQVIGTIVVLIAVTTFLLIQRKQQQQLQQKQQQLEEQVSDNI